MSTVAINTVSINTAAMGGGASLTSGPRTHLRLTRRGRVVLTSLAAIPLVIAAGVFAINGGGAIATSQASTTTFDYVTVGPGQSLWQLAGDIAPSADRRDVVADIVHLNQLESTNVQPGQKIAIPTQYSK